MLILVHYNDKQKQNYNNMLFYISKLLKTPYIYYFHTVGNSTSVSGNGNSTAGSYQTYTNKSATVYQQTAAQPQGFSNTNYANTQVSNSSNYPSATNTYSSYNQASVNSYQTPQPSNVSTNVNNSTSVTSVGNAVNSGQNNSVNSR